nr:alpha/beta hydrolase [Marinifilum caeruleilacunae]
MKLKTLIKAIVYGISAIVILVLIWWIYPARTPKIKSKNSIASLEYIAIGGVEQSVLIRSHNKENPILLFMHGGPGMPMMYLAHEFQRPLEKNFTIVQWDRRGAGKTFARNVPNPQSMSVRQVIQDAYDLIDTLTNRYNHDKVFLVGHSFGSYLSSIMVHEKPEMFHAYVSVGQVVDSHEAIKIQKKFLIREAQNRGMDSLALELENGDEMYYENWLFKFGAELKNSTSFLPLILSGLQAPEYALPEVSAVAKGSSFSSQHMKYNVLDSSILKSVKYYKIPVYFFAGKKDYTTPFELVERYFNQIQAPRKELIYFENSAHFPFFEEPDRFCVELENVLLSSSY